MKINYRNILFNRNYIDFIFKTLVILSLFQLIFAVTVMLVINNLEMRIEKKYSFQIVKNYFKGMIVNPHAFMESANVYKSEGKYQKEKVELEFALALYRNSPNKDIARIHEIDTRIKKIDLELSSAE